MLEHGDDAGHCSNGLTAKHLREATAEERATYRKWRRAMMLFYCALLLMSGIAIVGYSNGGLMQLTNLSVHQTVASSRTN